MGWKEMNKNIKKEQVENFIEEWRYFCKRINWGSSFLDGRAIQFMNTVEKQIIELSSNGKSEKNE